MGTLYTIGHSTIPFEKFLALLQKYQVNFLADVRSVPYSEYAQQFDREVLAKQLAAYDITYYYMGTYFGARRKERELYTPEGYLDFEKVRKQTSFRQRVSSIITGLERGNNIALMCTEKDPFDCHRAILVGRGFELAGIRVLHILHDGSLQSQEQLNERLIRKYFPDYWEQDLFLTVQKSKEEYLIEAYRERNRDIGYWFPKNYMREVRVGDVTDVSILSPAPNEFQPENYLVDLHTPIRVQKHYDDAFVIDYMEPYLYRRQFLFGNLHKVLTFDEMKKNNISLAWVHVRDVLVHLSEYGKTCTSFRYRGCQYQDIHVTDSDFFDLRDDSVEISEAYFLMSLPHRPWRSNDGTDLYFKFVAKILPVSRVQPGTDLQIPF